MKFLEELKRRNVIKASIAYLVVNWVLLQLLSILLPIVEAPDWVLKTLTLLMVLGFPIWAIISWVYEVTPDGLKRTSKIPEDSTITAKTNKRLNILILVALVIAIVVGLFGRTSLNSKTSSINNSVILEKTIAVLPFDDLSKEGDTNWFCDGVTEDILTHLSKIKGFKKVISRTSVKKFKGSSKTIPEIAKELGVSYILEGSVRTQGNKVLITSQLIDVNDNHLWADNYEENLEDVFKIQSEVAKKIVQQLQIVISSEEEKVLYKEPTNNFEAYELFLKGRSIADNRTPKDLATSIELFQKAVDLDPNYADAYAEMAASYRLLMYDYDFGNEITFEKINSLLEKALKIDPNNVRAYTIKGMMYISKQNWVKAKESYEKAIGLNSNDAFTNYYYAIYFANKPEADYKKAMEHTNIAQMSDPYSNPINIGKVYFLLKNDKFIEAEEFYKLNSSFFTDRAKLIMQNYFIIYKARMISIEKKDWTEAIKYLHKELEKDPKNIFIYRKLGDYYNNILNHEINYFKYAEKAYRLDSINWRNAIPYYNSLLKYKNYNAAKELLQSDNFKSIFNEEFELHCLFYWYYHQGKYKKALVSLDKYKNENHFELSINLAQQNKIKETYKMLNKGVLKNYEKAIVFAILKERDSMYYHINNEKDIYNILKFNGFHEVDPYRKEERYKAFLKKNYLPITHWNE